MTFKISSNSISVLLSTLVILQLSHGHPDCNHDVVVKNFFYVCNSYNEGPNSIKRETHVADGSGILFKLFPQDGRISSGFEPTMQAQQQSLDLHHQQGGYVVSPEYVQQPQLPFYPAHVQYPWSESMKRGPSFTIPFQNLQDAPRRKGNNARIPSSATIPNEPEDFASFNNWYLNPVYAESDWQHALERWRRRSYINDEIWKFVRNKCCVTGCPFPKDYWELDKRVNICNIW